MPAIKEYIITEKQLRRRLSSELQQKLKVVMKCYTIRNFVLNENCTFTFKKSYMINKKRLNDENTLTGFYTVQNLEDGKYKLRITVN